MKPPVKVAVTGAAGNISYSLIFQIASGYMLGADQPVELQLIEIPPAMDALKGVVMELEDCAFPLVKKITATSDINVGFDDIDYAMLVGAKPRGPGMERKDLLLGNAEIFSAQGKALNSVAKRDVRVLVVGNPANTNALITMHNAPDIAQTQFTAMTRLDHQRTLSQLASKLNIDHTTIEKVAIWGNHSATQYPDVFHTQVAGKPVIEQLGMEWIEHTMIPDVQTRGAAIIKARGASSAASAAIAAALHMHDWALGGARADDWYSMAVKSSGQYGVDDDLVYSFPITCNGGQYSIVEGLEVSDFSEQRIRATEQELIEERDAIRHLL